MTIEWPSSLIDGALYAEIQHLEQMCEGIHEVLAEGKPHGGFVTAMANKEYEDAFRRADSTNKRFFGALMYFRVWLCEDYMLPKKISETK